MLHTILAWVTIHQEALLALVGGATGLSAFAQVLLHKVKTKWGVQSKAFAYTVVQLLALISALAVYKFNGVSFIEVYPWLATTLGAVHRFVVSPYYSRYVLPYLMFLSEGTDTITDASAVPQYQPEQAAPAVPAVGFVS